MFIIKNVKKKLVTTHKYDTIENDTVFSNTLNLSSILILINVGIFFFFNPGVYSLP